MSDPKDDEVGIEVDLEKTPTPGEPAAPGAAGPADTAAAPPADDDAAPPGDEPEAESPELIETRRRLEALEDQTAQRDAEAVNQRRQENERKFGEALGNIDVRLNDVTEKIKAAKAAKVKALEEGKTAEQVELDDQLQDLKLEKARLEGAKTGVQQQFDRFKAAPPPEAQRPKYAKAEAWAQRNRWYGDGRFDKETQYAALVDKTLMLQGVDPNSDDYYKKMDEQLHKQFKHLAPPKRGTGPGPASPDRPAPTNRGRVRLTNDDFENMRRFGMDPDNKEHLRRYALEKRDTAAGG